MLVICPIAGVGSRLHPFTISKPKAMIKVAGKIILDHLIDKLKKTFPKGTPVCFIVGYKKKIIIDHLMAHHADYFDFKFVDQEPAGYNKQIPYYSGLGDAINYAGQYGAGQDCFIFLSDRLPMEDYSQMVEIFKSRGLDGIINTRHVNDPQHYGVCVVNKNDVLTRIVEKPQEFIADLAVSGAYLFGKSISTRLFELLDAQAKTPMTNGKEHQFTPIIQQLITEGFQIGVNTMQREILDFGRISRLLDGNAALLRRESGEVNGEISVPTTSQVVATKFIPPVSIGENCHISRSVIGPNVSVGDGCTINSCNLRDAVVGDHTCLKKVLLCKSVVGDYVSLENLSRKNISIGDNSTISPSHL